MSGATLRCYRKTGGVLICVDSSLDEFFPGEDCSTFDVDDYNACFRGHSRFDGQAFTRFGAPDYVNYDIYNSDEIEKAYSWAICVTPKDDTDSPQYLEACRAL